MWTHLNARVTINTNLWIPFNFPIGDCERSRRTRWNTISAMNTCPNGLGIMTKQTSKRTCLKKDGEAVAWSIYIGKWDDFINWCFHFVLCDPRHEPYPEHPCQTQKLD